MPSVSIFGGAPRTVNIVVREQFTGDGSDKTFQLDGTMGNCTLNKGTWAASQIQTAYPAHVTGTDKAPTYDSVNLITRNRIGVSSIDVSGLVTLDYAPRSEVSFYVWYWYNLSANDEITYYREDFVASMEEQGAALAGAISVDVTDFGGILSSADTTVQAALDTIDDHLHDGRYYTETEVDTLFTNHGAAADPHAGYVLESDHTKAAHDALGLSHDSLADVSTDDHHAQSHVLDGGDHTVSGLTIGHFLKATGATTFAFAAHGLTYTDVGAAASAHTHDDRYYTETEMDAGQLDARYYTETEVDTLFTNHGAAADPHAGYVLESLFDAHTVLYATSDNTPAALSVTEQTLVGRLTGGNISAVAIGIANDNIVQIDSATVANLDYAKFTTAGIEGKSYSEVVTDLQTALDARYELDSHLHDGETLQCDGINSGMAFSFTTAGAVAFNQNISVQSIVYAGQDNAQRGFLCLYGSTAANVQGGVAAFYTAADHDTNIDYYAIQATSDDFTIGPAGALDLFKMVGAAVAHDVSAIVFNEAGNDVDFRVEASGAANALFVRGSDGLVQMAWGLTVGVYATYVGVISLYGHATSSTTGGQLNLYLAADHDDPITLYRFQGYQDDLWIGPSTDPDALKLDSNKDLWITDGDLHIPNMKSGANQAAAGAAAGELWHDTDDDTIKMGV